jgi:signal transduction histidine kinase
MEESERRILCSIQDNGIGIEKRFFDKIFIIFQRLNPEYEGSGAGLAIVKKIIELYQGQIWLESDTGKGTTFYFSLPK